MIKKITYILFFTLLFNPFTFSFAKTKIVYEKANELANTYIDNSINDENWKDKNPQIKEKGKYYYTDDENNPSYIEFKVSCDKTINCGFVLVNIDGDDVSVPIASTSGVGPGEILRDKSGDTENTKLYYFGPLDQYAQNTTTQEVHSIKPEYNFVDKPKKLSYYEKNSNISKEEQAKELEAKKQELLEKQKQEKNNSLKNKLEELKSSSKEFKKSEEFKTKKEEIKDQILNLPKEEFVINNLDTSFAAYTNPGTSDVILPGGIPSSDCVGSTPCYDQFATTYNGESCLAGCGPVAVGIVFGYYDRNGYPDLIPGNNHFTNNIDVNNMIRDIGGIMGTYCDNYGQGKTKSILYNYAEIYAKQKGYSNSTSNLIWNINTSQIFNHVKSEIDGGKPIIINVFSDDNTSGHSVVAFGYKSNSNKIVRVNLGYGGTSSYYGYYYYSNIDQNLDAVYFNGSGNNKAGEVVKINISN